MPETTLDPEDAKLVTLARAARARAGAVEGAAVRDETGRTYAATRVDLAALRLSALQLAVAMAVSSGARTLEAAAVVTAADPPGEVDLAAVREVGRDAPVVVADPDGRLRLTL